MISKWENKELGKLFEFSNGINFSSKEKGSGLLTVDVKNMYSNVLDVNMKHLYRVNKKVPRTKLLQKGDILFVRSSVKKEGIGWPAIFPGYNEDVSYCGFIIRGRPVGEQFDPRFLTYFLRQAHVRMAVVNESGSTALTNISQPRLGSIKVPLPPLSEQKRIAAILDKADAIRRKRKAALDMADEFLRATFLDMFGDPVTNPKGWDVKPLGEVIATIRNGLSPSTKGTYPGKVFTLSAVTGADFLPKAKKEALFDKDPTTYEATSNDFLICRGNGNLKLVGKAKFPKGNYQGITFPDTVIAANVLTEIILPEVLEAQWATFFIRDQIERGARTTNGTHKINQSVIKNIEVAIPDMKAQLAFKKNVQGMSRYLSKTTNAHADTLFASLSQRAFQGKL